jgi:predicted transcriptional regulator
MSDGNANSNVDLASNLTVAWLSNPNTRANAEEATGFLETIHGTLASLANGQSETPELQSRDNREISETYEPAVTVRKSLASKDHIISLIDGKPYSTLKRHLGSHGLTPDQYRERYGLKADYPMVAPAYAEKRRALAKKIGLGVKTVRKRRTKSSK